MRSFLTQRAAVDESSKPPIVKQIEESLYNKLVQERVKLPCVQIDKCMYLDTF